jgi:digeranylgeranylglycerophospholipid reductase
VIRGGKRVSRLSFRRPAFGAIQRSVLDRVLAERAVAAGAELACDTHVTRIVPGAPMQLRIRRDGALTCYEARVVVAADGIPTLARRDLGIGFDPARQWCAHALKYQAEYDGAYPADQFEFGLDEVRLPGGYFWVFPKTGYLNIGAGMISRFGRANLDELIQQLSCEAGLDWQRIHRRQRRGGVIPFEMARRWVCDGAVVVGDAAGLVSPISGAGIAYAIRSGEIAGEVLSEALQRGDTSARGLAAYPRRYRRSRDFASLTALRATAQLVWSLQRHRPSSYRRFMEYGYLPLTRLAARLRRA